MNFDFKPFLGSYDAEMLSDACVAVTETGLWDWVKEFTPEEGKGFFMSNHPNLNIIHNKMKTNHSGASFAVTMRAIEFIAKNGLKAYCVEIEKSIQASIWAWECKEPKNENHVMIINKTLDNLKADHARVLKALEAFNN